ncbi:MAG TPA: YeeE/YedE thiosulfate transporter family protein [Bacteroidales bacterium]|nr:YeeE/YedE thiosulfate transporter family protein [Bacteroidales bacterium]
MGPLIPNGIIPGNWNFVIALLIGIAFGFILESSGFSSSRNIVGVFYGYNFVVLRVFFTAVIVAMVGLLYFDHFGLIDLKRIFILPTYVGPMILGGVMMGIGFIMGGFCPGTSFTAIAIGKLDAVAYLLGIYLGIGVFTLAYPAYAGFFNSGFLGNITLTQFTGIPAHWFALAFTVVALVAFWAVRFVERRIRKNITEYKF